MSSLLALETSSPVLSVALRTDKGALLEKNFPGIFKHSENILDIIDKLLSRARTSISKVAAFLIVRGPGSFTGLRVGFATLKGFLAVKNRPCFGAMSLDLIPHNAGHLALGSRLCVAIDAHREMVYARFYNHAPSGWRSHGKTLLLRPEELARQVKPGTFMAGDALARYREFFKDNPSLDEKAWYPRASTLIRFYETGSKSLSRLAKPADFLPLYLRLSGAEEKKKAYAHAC